MAGGAKFAVFLLVTLSISGHVNSGNTHRGRWKMLRRSIGISAMHTALLHNGMILSFDRTDAGASNISLPADKCLRNRTHDCSAHSVEFDPRTRIVRPLTVLTDTWCSSGALSGDGVLIQSGGYGDGELVVRSFLPCKDCDWVEHENGLAVRRWYATNHILPDGRIIVVGGRRQFSYEFIPKSFSETAFELPFLRETRDQWENNLYPFVHLSTDGNLFIFANTKSILLDYVNHRVVRSFPVMPGGFSRNYPSSGSSVLLPLRLDHNAYNVEAEVMICGGSRPESISMANISIFWPASSTCGRLRITDTSPEWQISAMPIERVMGDMVLLPTGDVLIINGAARGTAGWEMAREPVTTPVLYRTGITTSGSEVSGSYEVLNPSEVPRLYHSTANLLPDGRVLVGGSNPHVRYEFTGAMFPTELSLEAFYPPYLSATAGGGRIMRPKIKIPAGDGERQVIYGQRSTVEFVVKSNRTVVSGPAAVAVTVVAPSFTTHSFSMNQRLLVLKVDGLRGVSRNRYAVDLVAPANRILAPPGYYLMFLVHRGVPSKGKWVLIK